MPKTSAAAKEGRRTQILNAAVRCFARRGYYATTIEDLVTETGLSRGALYLYYPSKEAIYLAISERWGCGLEEAIRARLAPDLSPAAILRMLIEVTGEHVQAEADACRILMEGWNLAHQIPELAERVRQEHERSHAALGDLLRAGIATGEFRANLDVESQVLLLEATLHGLMVQWHRRPGSVDWRRAAEEIVRGLRL
ncbi:MAG TPA: TetR family transcriptional regulator [Ktedonobacteraceae bacterium]|nr:TetR family transcriptional regulator [Ktedonobacteraceae bacterium]